MFKYQKGLLGYREGGVFKTEVGTVGMLGEKNGLPFFQNGVNAVVVIGKNIVQVLRWHYAKQKYDE